MTQKPNPTDNQANSPVMEEEWLTITEAATVACTSVRTIQRAIRDRKIFGKKIGSTKNASTHVSMASLEAWLVTRKASRRKKTEKTNSASPPQKAQDESGITFKKNSEPKKSKKKVPSKELKRLRRWKNFMRGASQEQMLSMIRWLSSRLKQPPTSSKR